MVSIGLIVEVLDHAPDTLTSGERLVLVVLAEWANDKTRVARQSHNWTIDTICRRAGIKRSGLKSILQGLAKKGLEVRVPVKEKDGKPVYAYEGTSVTFRIPALGAQRGGHSIPSDDARGDATASERGGHSIREGMPQPPPSPQGSPLKKIPSSLSSSGAGASAPNVPAQQAEREIEGASQNNQTDNPIHRLLLDAGCPSEKLTEAERWITDECQPRGLGWWRKTAGNGDLNVHVTDFLKADVPSCPDCDDTGQTGDWMNPRDCGCIWWKDPAAARKAFVAQLKDFPDCAHGEVGGNVKAPNGWQHCSLCRGPGWVDPDLKPRTEEKPANRRYQPWRPPQDQSVYDRPFSGQVARSPADQRVIDAGPLYEKYRALEANQRSGKHETFKNPPIDAYYGDL